MYERRRNLVRRHADGRLVNVARFRGQLFVCADGCCCGRTEDGFAAVPRDIYHAEWERRRLRNVVHLTVGGCLGPCALANVALLVFEGRSLWFHSIDSAATVYALFDYIEQLLDTDSSAPAPEALAPHQFTASAWQARPDGQVVDDYRPRRRTGVGAAESPAEPVSDACHLNVNGDAPEEPIRIVADMAGPAAAPRKNGELVFETPWQGRAFGMAVALHQQELYPWDDFRDKLVAQIARADAESDPSGYYERWLAAFEKLLSERGVVSPEELDERTYEFEFGERDDIY